MRESKPKYIAQSDVRKIPKRVTFASAKDVAQAMQDLAGSDVENFVIFSMTIRNSVIARHTIAVGSLSGVAVHPRSVFRRLLADNAAVWICAHNHPSNDPSPSPEDLELTHRLTQASELLGIQLLDHVIVTQEGGYVSLAERNHLRKLCETETIEGAGS